MIAGKGSGPGGTTINAVAPTRRPIETTPAVQWSRLQLPRESDATITRRTHAVGHLNAVIEPYSSPGAIDLRRSKHAP